jgi:hypothetical protein
MQLRDINTKNINEYVEDAAVYQIGIISSVILYILAMTLYLTPDIICTPCAKRHVPYGA